MQKLIISKFSHLQGILLDVNKFHVESFQEVYKGGFIYINGAFYVDFGDGALDISENIINWTAKHPDKFPNVSKHDICGVKIRDVKFELGVPYLYMHLGECEHILSFDDCR